MMRRTSTTSTRGGTFIWGTTTASSRSLAVIAMLSSRARARMARGGLVVTVQLPDHERHAGEAHLLRPREQLAHVAVRQVLVGPQDQPSQGVGGVLGAEPLHGAIEIVALVVDEVLTATGHGDLEGGRQGVDVRIGLYDARPV